MKKKLAILGSTGSIGIQALEVVRNHSDRFGVEVLTTQNNCNLLIEQAIEFKPNAVVIGNETLYPTLNDTLGRYQIKVFAGQNALAQVVEMDGPDTVLNALVGYAGMIPTFQAISSGKHIALANKESLVIAGDLIMNEALKNSVEIIPVDSEHSALFQCLVGEDPATIEKIFLTASGGPFRGKNREELGQVLLKEALNHPNWAMGNKITIDSATMMNKGLEVIEAHWLFGLRPDQIDIVIHPQSVIHSIVQFVDGSMKAQLGVPDMRLPILYALSFPERIATDLPRLNFSDYPTLTFDHPDTEVFRALGLAYQAMETGGTAPAILNAANEVAVQAFLDGALPFLGIPAVIERSLEMISVISNPVLNDFIETHHQSILQAKEIISDRYGNFN
ncbi:MAG: 1-deoxy-D-xylulose-5-phosphate reductoisomerase [Bacteroidetes bacterium]|nr:1-deoxy-D-xylulose-5-phosphate reductoisomerase [Bacteroidota bacterium]